MYIKAFILLVVAATQTHGLSLSHVFQDPETFDPKAFDMGNSQTVLLNDRILFAGRSDQGSALWALDINTLEKTVLQTGYATNGRIEFIRLGDEVFFKFNTDVNSGAQLWHSDGTVAGTQLFAEGMMSDFVPLKKSGDVLIGVRQEFGGQAQLVVTDGIDLVVHAAEPTYSEQICAYSPDLILMHDSTGDFPVYRRSTSTTSEVLDIPVPDDFISYQTDLVSHHGACYVIAYDGSSNRGGELWEIEASGQINNISERLDLDDPIKNVVSHDGGLYIKTTGINAKIHLLNNHLNKILASRDFYFSTFLFSRGPYLVSMAFPTTSPPTITLDFLRSDLSESVETFSGYRGPSPRNPPDFFDSNGQWVMAKTTRTGQLEPIESVVFNPFETTEKTLNLPQMTRHQVISATDQDRLFVLSLDQEYRGTLFEVEDTPSIGPSIDGSWIDPNLKNQGLMLRTGERQDGSEYLIATVYTFQNGHPFWLAGVANIEPLMKTISVEMFSFDGIDFFEPEIQPEQSAFGRLTLEMTACHTLDMVLIGENTSEVHTLLRVDDVKATKYCTD